MTGLPAAEPASDATAGWPAVTVVIPTRDRPALLRTAVGAVLAQDYPGEVRCVVVHDGTEPDPALESRPGRGDHATSAPPAWRAPATPASRWPGPSSSRSATTTTAGCRTSCRPRSRCCARTRGARFVSCGIRVRYGDRLVERTLPGERVTFAELLRDRLTELHPSTFLIRRSLLAEIGPVDEELPGSYAEDYELLLRAARVAPIRSLPTVHVEVLWHQKSYFTGRWATVSAALRRLLDSYPDFYREPAGAARVTGQIAFAEAALGNRRQALRWAVRTARLRPTEPRALLALAVASRAVTGERVVRELNSRGRGI